MIIVLVLLGVALAISLAVNLGLIGGQKPTAQAPSNTSSSVKTEVRTDDERARKAEAELDKKTKELGDVKKSLSDLKDELKTAKKKLFEQKEGEKAGDDLVKARAEVERQASIQLDATRAELAAALADIAKLKTEAENKGKKKVEKKEEVKAEKPQEVVTRVIRELNDVEKERIAKLEAQSSNDRKKANELDRELKSLRAKFERHNRDTKRVYADANLARDKFRAVELRLNRTTMENDLLKRAIKDLEKKSGVDAGRLELTAEELSTGDSSMKAKHAAEDAAEADARAKLEAAPATLGRHDALEVFVFRDPRVADHRRPAAPEQDARGQLANAAEGRIAAAHLVVGDDQRRGELVALGERVEHRAPLEIHAHQHVREAGLAVIALEPREHHQLGETREAPGREEGDEHHLAFQRPRFEGHTPGRLVRQ